MKITVFGATGGVGLAFIDQAIAQGHTLKCLVRSPDKLPESIRSKCELIQGDVYNSDDVAKSFDSDTEACLITLGSRPGQKQGADVCSQGTKVILDVMKQKNLDPKTVVVSSLGVGDSREDVKSWFVKLFMNTLIKKPLEDKEIQERYLKESHLSNWTIARPGGLSTGPWTGKYRTGKFEVTGSSRVSRADVADFCLKCFTSPGDEWKKKASTIAGI